MHLSIALVFVSSVLAAAAVRPHRARPRAPQASDGVDLASAPPVDTVGDGDNGGTADVINNAPPGCFFHGQEFTAKDCTTWCTNHKFASGIWGNSDTYGNGACWCKPKPGVTPEPGN